MGNMMMRPTYDPYGGYGPPMSQMPPVGGPMRAGPPPMPRDRDRYDRGPPPPRGMESRDRHRPYSPPPMRNRDRDDSSSSGRFDRDRTPSVGGPDRFAGRDRRGPGPGPGEMDKIQPGRRLFIRNIDYGTSESMVREKFEEFGEIKSIFNLLERRGLVFVTYVSFEIVKRSVHRA